MSEPDPSGLARSLMRCALFLAGVVLLILGTSSLLSASAPVAEDLTLLVPSILLFLAPYLMGVIEAAWGLSLVGSAVLTLLVVSLCTALFFLSLGTFGNSRADARQDETKLAMGGVLPTG